MRLVPILLTFFAFSFTSCAERTEFQRSLGSWVGSNETQLIKSWGQPEKIISQGHTRYLVYQHRGPGKTESPAQAADTITDCVITFESLDEVIVSSRYEGTRCE